VPGKIEDADLSSTQKKIQRMQRFTWNPNLSEHDNQLALEQEHTEAYFYSGMLKLLKD